MERPSVAFGFVEVLRMATARMGMNFEAFLAGIVKSTPLVRSDKPENVVAGRSRI